MTAMRPETTLEHIARDMREGRFPERSEPQMVANLAAPERIWAWAWQTVPMGQWGVTPSPSSVEYIRADLAAVQPAQVRVKPLVWGADPEVPDCINAGNYDIYLEDDGYQLYFWSVICGGPHRSLVNAQAAGEAHNKSAILAALEPQPDQTVEIDLRVAMMEELEKAASESPWVPKEYYMNEVISDCCAFLREDRTPQGDYFEGLEEGIKIGRGEPQPISKSADLHDPRDEVIARLVEALTKMRALMCEAIEDDDGNSGCSQCVNDCTGCIAHAALAAAKAVQK